MPIKSAEIEEITQRIEHGLDLDLDQRPSRVKRWFVNNIFRRVFAYLIAWDSSGNAVRVRASTSGFLQFIPLPSTGFSDYISFDGTATDAYAGATETFPTTYYQIDILVENFDLLLQFKKADDTWGNDIVLTTGWHSVAFECKGARLKNRTPGSNGDYSYSVYT